VHIVIVSTAEGEGNSRDSAHLSNHTPRKPSFLAWQLEYCYYLVSVFSSQSQGMTRRSRNGIEVGLYLRMQLVELHALGVDSVARNVIARAAGYRSAKQPGFLKVLQAVRSAGLIEYTGNFVRLSEQGMQATPLVPAPQDNAEVLARLQRVLRTSNPGMLTKLDHICQFLSDGRQRSLDEVGAATGYADIEAPGFAKVISTLKGLGLVVRVPGLPGLVMLADMAFPFGRP
jgi:hypothetical protein